MFLPYSLMQIHVVIDPDPAEQLPNIAHQCLLCTHVKITHTSTIEYSYGLLCVQCTLVHINF